MFGYFITCTSNDKAGSGRDIKGVLAVATGTNNVDIAVGFEDGRNARLFLLLPYGRTCLSLFLLFLGS